MDPGSAPAVTLIAGAAGGSQSAPPPTQVAGHPLPSQCPSTASGDAGEPQLREGRTAPAPR